MPSIASFGLIAAAPKFLYAIPLVIAISLVYGATRHEYLKEILIQSARSARWVVGFMGIILVVIWVAGFWN